MNSYHLGKERARLTDNGVAPWMLKEGRKPLIKTNEAFDLYYVSYQRIRQLYKSPAKSHISLASKQEVKLRDLAAVGYGSWVCCSDLNSIFDYYYNHNGTYREDGSMVQETLFYSGGGYCTVPRGINSFLQAYAAYAEELGVLFKSFDQYARDLINAKKNNQWNEVGKSLGNIKTITDKTSEYLWLMPYDTVHLTGYVEKLTKWTDGVDTIYNFASTYLTNYGGGMSNSQSLGSAMATEAFKKVLGKLPVFGDVYIKALECVPALMKWATALRDERERQIRALGL